jgi:hypothetical protein
MQNYKFLELYLTVIENKETFDSKLDEYWDLVQTVWKENGSKKLHNMDTGGSEESIYYDYLEGDDILKAKKIDARELIVGNELESFAFAWYCAADLINSTKYFSMPQMSGSTSMVFKLNKNSTREMVGDWSNKSALNIANYLLPQATSWEKSQSNEIINDILADTGIDIIKQVLPKGFSDFVNKKSSKKSIKAKVSVIKNKMDFMVWKKFLTSKKMTQDHFKNCMKTRVEKGFWSPVWNEVVQVDGLTDKKYFLTYFKNNGISDYVDGLHPTLAKLILKKITGFSNYPSIFTCVAVLENIDFSLGDTSYDEFSSTNDFSNYIKNLQWNAFKKGNTSKALFCEDNFLRHLDEIYRN